MSEWMHDTTAATSAGLVRSRVIAILDGFHVVVECDDDRATPCLCDVLITSDAPPQFAEGDLVLVARNAGDHAQGVVLGRLGPSRHPTTPAPHRTTESEAAGVPATPDTLVLEAKHSLTLRVGDGSITIREDGKILIKGKDLVSHATRMNRIKGGAVSIN